MRPLVPIPWWAYVTAFLLTIAMLASGCATGAGGERGLPIPLVKPVSEVKIEKAQFCLAYAGISKTVAVVEDRLSTACKAGKLDASTCEWLKQAQGEIMQLDLQAQKAITDPAVEVDWQQISQFAKFAIGAAKMFMVP